MPDNLWVCGKGRYGGGGGGPCRCEGKGNRIWWIHS